MTTSERPGPARALPPPAWWRRAVVYEVYVRSFADADGDGLGDLAGMRSRLAYLADLGVDALWITPWYPSALADGGYDVDDFRSVDPRLGSLDEARALFADAHRLGLRVILDVVPNHTSTRHRWFREALAARPGSAARSRYLFRDGRGHDGSEPPNNWRSVFGGPAWTRVVEPDGRPGQWYLHLFAPEQPDLDWSSPEVRAEFVSILELWLDLGVDGFRVDVANALLKEAGLPDLPPAGSPEPPPGSHPHWGREELHDLYRSWRRALDARGGRAVLLGEIGEPPWRLARSLRPDELHGAFAFDFMRSAWDAEALREVIDVTLAAHAAVGARPTWLLSNHDETRHLTRYGRAFSGIPWGAAWVKGQGSDLALGARRARAAALLMLALPGRACLYQGEELGLWEVEDLPVAALRDPVWERSGRTDRGRDGCRVPLPWSGAEPPYGFGPPGSVPWLPQPAGWGAVSVEAEAAEPGSMLALYRRALAVRRTHPGLAGDALRWRDGQPGALVFERDAGLVCAVNLGDGPLPLPPGTAAIVSSAALEDAALPVDAAAWLAPA